MYILKYNGRCDERILFRVTHPDHPSLPIILLFIATWCHEGRLDTLATRQQARTQRPFQALPIEQALVDTHHVSGLLRRAIIINNPATKIKGVVSMPRRETLGHVATVMNVGTGSGALNRNSPVSTHGGRVRPQIQI